MKKHLSLVISMGLVLLTIMSLSSCQKEVLTSDITPSQSFDITLDDAVRIAQSYNISTKDSTKAARVTGINAISNRKYASGVFTPNGTSNNYNSGLTMITGIRK